MYTSHRGLFSTKKQMVKLTRRPFKKVLFVDPGFEGSGWAFFRYLQFQKSPLPPTQSGVFKPSEVKRLDRWGGQAEEICGWFDGLCSSLKPLTVVLEYPELWVTSNVSQTAAVKGDLFKLTFLIGGMAEVARRHDTSLPILIYTRQWKGQLPKKVVVERIVKVWPKLKRPRNHEGDAIGMGLAAQGRL